MDGTATCPNVEEATLDLGQLEGIWADVYGRQDALYAAQVAVTLKTWRKIVKDLDVDKFVAAFRREALMQDDGSAAAGTDHDSDAARQHHKDQARALAASLAAGMLAGVADSPDYLTLLAALTKALTLAAGEGYASALAIAASEAGHTRFGWDAAAQDGRQDPGYDALSALAAQIVAGAVTDIAVALPGLAATGATAAAMVTAVTGVLKDGRSLGVYLTHAMTAAIASAMVGVYDEASVKLLAFLTAGDSRVCPVCEEIEARNPYRLEDFPAPPRHPGCRCNSAPAGEEPIPPEMYARYLPSAA